MKKCILVICLASTIVLPLGVMAETAKTDTEHDALEVAVHGGLALPMGGVKTWNQNMGAKTGFNTGVDVGYYLNERYVLGFSFNYAQSGIDNGGLAGQHHRLYNPAFSLKRYFPGSSDLVPFVIVRAGVDFAKFSTFVYDNGVPKYRELSYNPNLSWSIGAGAHYYTSDFSALFVEADYHMGITKHSHAHYQDQNFVFGEDISMVDIRAGIVAFFGSSK